MASKSVLQRLAEALAGSGLGNGGGADAMATNQVMPPPTPPATANAAPLPGYQIPGMGDQGSLPPMAAYGAPTPQMAPVTASAPPMAPPAQMASAAMPDQPVDVPAMPASTQVDNPSVRDDIAAALATMKQKNMLPPGWAKNFGNLADQQA